jgi:hypothetical protein
MRDRRSTERATGCSPSSTDRAERSDVHRRLVGGRPDLDSSCVAGFTRARPRSTGRESGASRCMRPPASAESHSQVRSWYPARYGTSLREPGSRSPIVEFTSCAAYRRRVSSTLCGSSGFAPRGTFPHARPRRGAAFPGSYSTSRPPRRSASTTAGLLRIAQKTIPSAGPVTLKRIPPVAPKFVSTAVMSRRAISTGGRNRPSQHRGATLMLSGHSSRVASGHVRFGPPENRPSRAR